MGFTYAISMTRPHEALGLKQPVGRMLPQGLSGWNLALAVTCVLMILTYIVQVNGAASKAYRLRTVEKRVDVLRTEATILQNSYVMQTSLHALMTQAKDRGFVAVDKIEYLNPNSSAYALAR